ncbi:MAG: response regulator [bacterium]
MGKRILIVDDASFMRMMLKNILNEAGYEIVGEAENGKEAVDQYQEVNPDLVTMDITMPDMDGLEAVSKILEFDNNADIIMVSAMGQRSMVIEAIQAGAKDFIVKPFKPDRVLQALDNVFNG